MASVSGNLFRPVLGLCAILLLSGCARSVDYKSIKGTGLGFGKPGGYYEEQLEPGIWRVSFTGNELNTAETNEVYFLYHAAEVTLANGYDGFELLSPVNDVPYLRDLFGKPPRGLKAEGADIRLLKRPLKGAPPRIFDAARLKDELEPHVSGAKCDSGNVCPFVHRYLTPSGVMPFEGGRPNL